MPDHLELAVCPVCKTTDFRTLADAAAIRRQIEDLWEFHTRRLRPGAPVQQLFDRAVFSQDPPVHLVQCLSCGTVLRSPRESEAALVATYADEEPPRAALEDLFAEQAKFYAPRLYRLERLLGRTGSALEIGSYLGAFLQTARSRGWQAEGMDVNESANAFARAHGAVVHAGSIEELDEDRRFDVVAFWNCLDQLPDPERALRHARARLNDRGLIAVRVPNGGFYARLHDSPAGKRVLAHNNLLGFPYRMGFTPASIGMLLEQTGFSVERMLGDSLVVTAGSWTRGWAALEERVLKGVMRRILPAARAPWIEVYARAAYASAT